MSQESEKPLVESQCSKALQLEHTYSGAEYTGESYTELLISPTHLLTRFSTLKQPTDGEAAPISPSTVDPAASAITEFPIDGIILQNVDWTTDASAVIRFGSPDDYIVLGPPVSSGETRKWTMAEAVLESQNIVRPLSRLSQCPPN